MSKLSTEQRDNMPKGEFALPSGRYPINDKAHAANAKARATQQEEKGNLSASQKAIIDAKANKVLDGKMAAKVLAKKVKK